MMLVCGYVLADPGQPYLRLDLRYPGVYRVTGKEMADAGVDIAAVQPENLCLTSSGTIVPLLVRGLDNGRLSSNSTLEFVGDSPRGEATWFLPENKHNVYLLTWDNPGPSQSVQAQFLLKSAQVAADPASPDSGENQYFRQWRHFEKNYQFWFSTLPPDETDNFYWFPFFANTPPDGALKTFLSFPGFDKSLGIPATVGLHIFGATNADNLKPSHKFSFLCDLKPVGEFLFDNISLYDATFSISPDQVTEEPARISFQSPPERQQAVDKIYLDWMNVSYPSKFTASDQEYYTFNNDLVTSPPAKSTTSASLNIYDLPAGATIFDPSSATAWQLSSQQKTAAIPNSAIPTTYTVAAPYARLKVDHLDYVTSGITPSDLPADLQALVIYHPSLRLTAQSYTRYRRERGMNIAAVSIRSIFDQLNQGYIHDASLREYIKRVKARAPGLTHVVLIGDAYFDYREARSQDEVRQLEVLIPIHWVYRPGVTWSGGYQDDNWYGSFANEFRPDVSVGRLPVNTDAEGMEYLRKVIEYETFRKSAADPGLLISSVEQSFQDYVKEIGTSYSDKLSSFTYLFPQAETAAQEVTQLQDELNKGKQILYYVGHGGSLVWRVGPVDFSRQKDLFTPADVHKLLNKGHYPVVVCASCYTTAFDQPESIGEALVNQPGGGAIAVVGAPWKATVQESHEFNRLFFKYYFDPSVKTIGEASLKAHREHIPASQREALYNSFTLLGDPCLEIVR